MVRQKGQLAAAWDRVRSWYRDVSRLPGGRDATRGQSSLFRDHASWITRRRHRRLRHPGASTRTESKNREPHIENRQLSGKTYIATLIGPRLVCCAAGGAQGFFNLFEISERL